MQAKSCVSAWQDMTAAASKGAVRNYTQKLDMSDFVVETPLFPREVLEAYSAWNMELELTTEQLAYKTDERGGNQGDYRDGMAAKIDNVVDCLSRYPNSKRAVIVISNKSDAQHANDIDAKCLRELHLYHDDDNKLSATILLRAQAASIFPKNIHFVGSIMTAVAARLPNRPALGTVFYLSTILVSDRS